MSSSPGSTSPESTSPDRAADEAPRTQDLDEAPRTQDLDEQTGSISTLAVEPDDPIESGTAAYPSATTAIDASPDPVPSSPDPSPVTGWAGRGVRMRTVVLGLVLLAVSGVSLLRVLTDLRVDDSLVVLILLVVAGVLLLGGGVASALRDARSGRSAS